MWKSGQTETTTIGYTNRNKQKNLGSRGLAGNDHRQYAYKLECLKCGHEYGANGTDIFQRKCPSCQHGKLGIAF